MSGIAGSSEQLEIVSHYFLLWQASTLITVGNLVCCVWLMGFSSSAAFPFMFLFFIQKLVIWFCTNSVSSRSILWSKMTLLVEDWRLLIIKISHNTHITSISTGFLFISTVYSSGRVSQVNHIKVPITLWKSFVFLDYHLNDNAGVFKSLHCIDCTLCSNSERDQFIRIREGAWK